MLRLCDDIEELLEEGLATCLVLSSPGSGTDSIASKIERTGARVEVLSDALLAFSRVILSTRLNDERTAWGLRPAGRVGVVVIDEARISDIELFVDAIEMYVDDVGLCRIAQGTDAAPPPAVDDQPHGSAAHPLRRQKADASSDMNGANSDRRDPAVLRLAAERDETPSSTPHPDPEEGGKPAEVTREEIEMLLDRGEGGGESA